MYFSDVNSAALFATFRSGPLNTPLELSTPALLAPPFCAVFLVSHFPPPAGCRFVPHFPVQRFHVSHFQRPRIHIGDNIIHNRTVMDFQVKS